MKTKQTPHGECLVIENHGSNIYVTRSEAWLLVDRLTRWLGIAGALGQNDRVSWQNAKRTADEWCEQNLPRDLHGRLVQLISFSSDADCRWYYADRDAGFHRMITSAIARVARKRGAKVVYVPLLQRDFPAGQDASDQRQRTEFAESCHRIL